jgi:hypothetical protein
MGDLRRHLRVKGGLQRGSEAHQLIEFRLLIVRSIPIKVRPGIRPFSR